MLLVIVLFLYVSTSAFVSYIVNIRQNEVQKQSVDQQEGKD